MHYVLQLNRNNKSKFNDQIINKGNSLILATDKKGEVVFCSENVETILGYTVDQMMGSGYWNITEETNFYLENYETNENYILVR